jgi:hypothetical protein
LEYAPKLCARLAAEAREDSERLGVLGHHAGSVRVSIVDVKDDDESERDDIWFVDHRDAAAVVRSVNSRRVMADQLDAVCAEVERLTKNVAASDSRLAGVLDGTFAVGDRTVQREIERLHAGVEYWRQVAIRLDDEKHEAQAEVTRCSSIALENARDRDVARAEVERLTAAAAAKGNSLSKAATCRGSSQEDPTVTIRRLRQRLYVVEPVYRAAVALHRNGARETHEAIDRVELAVCRALDTEREIAGGGSISDADLDVEVP